MNSPLESLEQLHPRHLLNFTDPLRRLIRGKLWLQVLVGMVLGVAAGLMLSPEAGWVREPAARAIGEWIALPGHLFLSFIQMIVVPLILASIVQGIAGATDIQQLKRTGVGIGIYFLLAVVVAAVLGIGVALVLRPGDFVDASALLVSAGDAELPAAAAELAAGGDGVALSELPGMITGVLPTNPMGAIARGDMLQIVIFAVVLGLGLISLPPRSAKPLLDLFEAVQAVCMAVVGAVMTFAPVAVFGLLAQAMIKTGPSVLAGLGIYAGAVVLGMALLLVAYLIVVAVVARRNPLRFFVGIREPFLLAFSTNSSAATMPITAKSAAGLGIRPSIAQFVVPLGATVNMSGTALYQGLATLFMAQMFQMELPLSALVALVATALGASIGTPAVPGVGIVVLATVLTSAGVPLSGLALIIGLDQVLERFRTSLNVTGDLVGCAIMERFSPAELSGTDRAEPAEEASA
jgi:Na+/H+-dicarboxylate symporter